MSLTTQYKHEPPRAMTNDEMERFLKKCSSARLGLAFQNEPYVVPVSYGYDKGKAYFHSSKQGKKVDFIKRNSRVCFEVDEWEEKGWASVICYGTATLSEDIEARREYYRVIRGQEPSDEQLGKWSSYSVVIQIEEMTGKCSPDYSF